MTNHLTRLYAVTVGVLVFFLTWAAVSARPWAATDSRKDPRMAALDRREARLHRESIRVRRVVNHRYHVYRVKLRERRKEIAAIEAANARAQAAATAVVAQSAAAPVATAAPPQVSVVSAPPVTSSHSS
jgi:hypothetical protein